MRLKSPILAIGWQLLSFSEAQEESIRQSALIKNPGTNTIVGFECNWDGPENWCAGWQNADYSQADNYDPKEHFPWVVRRGSSLSPATGPSFDHTVGDSTGQYLALIGRDKKFLSRAEITSPRLDLSVFEEYCFSMWYHMFGRHTFSLNVHISIPNTRSDREMVFKASGSVSKTGQDWLFMQQTIKRPSDWSPSEGPGPHYVNIIVKGVRGLSYQSDIALDDLKFVPGPCPDKPPVVRTTPAPTTASSTAAKTTKAPTTKFNPMNTREYQPFYTPKLENCDVITMSGAQVTERYYVQTHVCCGGKISSRMAGGKCCEGKQYFNRKQACCAGQVINKLKYSCCNDEITELAPGNFCCGDKTYPSADKTKRCCGGTTIFSPVEDGCCGNQVFSRVTHYCCGDEVLSKSDPNTQCCGEGVRGQSYKPGGRTSCCFGNTYNNIEYGCCGQKYVFHKLYEMCLNPECVGDTCPEMAEDQELTVKKKHSWRKTAHRASKYLFSYKSRKRRDTESMKNELSPAEGVKLFEEKRAQWVVPT